MDACSVLNFFGTKRVCPYSTCFNYIRIFLNECIIFEILDNLVWCIAKKTVDRTVKSLNTREV